mmetsp:Transcript_10945/g.24273  ORF Transcript_10945/g.24273 Transcript_10945/m.24273 type:complete len:203 (+) Transcript_10945:413-1021(+)
MALCSGERCERAGLRRHLAAAAPAAPHHRAVQPQHAVCPTRTPGVGQGGSGVAEPPTQWGLRSLSDRHAAAQRVRRVEGPLCGPVSAQGGGDADARLGTALLRPDTAAIQPRQVRERLRLPGHLPPYPAHHSALGCLLRSPGGGGGLRVAAAHTATRPVFHRERTRGLAADTALHAPGQTVRGQGVRRLPAFQRAPRPSPQQ